MDQNKARLLSGIFAVSNMGLPLPKPEKVTWAKKAPTRSDTDWAYFFGQEYMESDEIADTFSQEARSWQKRLKKTTDEEFAARWPDIAKLYDEA